MQSVDHRPQKKKNIPDRPGRDRFSGTVVADHNGIVTDHGEHNPLHTVADA